MPDRPTHPADLCPDLGHDEAMESAGRDRPRVAILLAVIFAAVMPISLAAALTADADAATPVPREAALDDDQSGVTGPLVRAEVVGRLVPLV